MRDQIKSFIIEIYFNYKIDLSSEFIFNVQITQVQITVGK